MCSAQAHVRFTPESGHQMRHSGMSALDQKADIGTITGSGKQRSHARQNHPDFGELARFRVDVD
jgi:hypothetical protein